MFLCVLTAFSILCMTLLANFNVNKAEQATAASTSASSMAVLEVTTGRVLYSKNMHEKRAPASTTKILTAIVVIENVADLDKVHKIPDSAVGVEGSSIYLQKGEEMSVRDLLYGLMLQSGNDCAESLAIITAGCKVKFAELMNQTAKRVGALNSNFVTAHGLDADGHYTTAYDLAVISAYALRNPEFAKISATKKHSAPYAGRDYNRVIVNKNRLLNSFDGADGVKTGFTRKAGRTFVGSATRNGMQVVCAVLNCGPMFEDTARLMTAAFNEFSMVPLSKHGVALTRVKVDNGRNTDAPLGGSSIIYYPLRASEVDQIEKRFVIPDSIKAPQLAGSNVGQMQIYLQNELLYTTNLVTIENVDSYNLKDRLRDIASNWSIG